MVDRVDLEENGLKSKALNIKLLKWELRNMMCLLR